MEINYERSRYNKKIGLFNIGEEMSTSLYESFLFITLPMQSTRVFIFNACTILLSSSIRTLH